ncbi:MAG: alpha-amylase family glycosyl hydrolase, partial [Planctomycetota bacterium]|nr:alpha-amylase family glycosyl hydrolase [Planctomycetota bacterium]
MTEPDHPSHGVRLTADGACRVAVWAPRAEQVDIVFPAGDRDPERLDPAADGWFRSTLRDVRHGDRYLFRLDGELERPDPASRSQPDGVHKPSQVIAADYDWRVEQFNAPSLENLVLYELHIGAFTREGTFDAAIDHLDRLADLGVTAISLMPVAQCPGARNWGYDGVYPFAVQHSYGGPNGLKRFVDACHARGMGVILDVVYNHLGPEGCYVRDFGPYFTDRYKTPWGEAINFDGRDSDPVRAFFIENALQWIDEFRIDGLRLDAVHAIADSTAKPFLEELTE